MRTMTRAMHRGARWALPLLACTLWASAAAAQPCQSHMDCPPGALCMTRDARDCNDPPCEALAPSDGVCQEAPCEDDAGDCGVREDVDPDARTVPYEPDSGASDAAAAGADEDGAGSADASGVGGDGDDACSAAGGGGGGLLPLLALAPWLLARTRRSRRQKAHSATVQGSSGSSLRASSVSTSGSRARSPSSSA